MFTQQRKHLADFDVAAFEFTQTASKALSLSIQPLAITPLLAPELAQRAVKSKGTSGPSTRDGQAQSTAKGTTTDGFIVSHGSPTWDCGLRTTGGGNCPRTKQGQSSSRLAKRLR